MKVYKAINAVHQELAKIGISKDRQVQSGATRFNYRSIDDIYNVLSPLLAKHGLVIVPRVQNRSLTEKINKNGNTLFFTHVDVEYDLISIEDGSKHTARMFGEAMDTGDKSTNKAMSSAYKYMCFQLFAIPTDGDNDPDATVHDVKSDEEIRRDRIRMVSDEMKKAKTEEKVNTLYEKGLMIDGLSDQQKKYLENLRNTCVEKLKGN